MVQGVSGEGKRDGSWPCGCRRCLASLGKACVVVHAPLLCLLRHAPGLAACQLLLLLRCCMLCLPRLRATGTCPRGGQRCGQRCRLLLECSGVEPRSHPRGRGHGWQRRRPRSSCRSTHCTWCRAASGSCCRANSGVAAWRSACRRQALSRAAAVAPACCLAAAVVGRVHLQPDERVAGAVDGAHACQLAGASEVHSQALRL